jgi:threonine/homoserine/homoserine lactone efflux protein
MLPDYPILFLFLTSVIIINLIPGADVLFVASQALVNRKQGILAVLGISSGIIVYIIATACGLAQIFRHSEIFFNLIKIVGVLYLLYLAWQAFFTNTSINIDVCCTSQSRVKAYSKGLLTNLLNPKVGLFFLTFLPQFVDAHKGKIGLQLLSLGLCFIVSGTIINLIYVFIFSQLKERVFSKTWVQKWLNKITAFIFCLIALKVLTSRQA